MNSVMLMYEEKHLARNFRRFSATAVVKVFLMRGQGKQLKINM